MTAPPIASTLVTRFYESPVIDISAVLSARITEGVGEISSYDFSVPSLELTGVDIDDLNEVSLSRSSEGEIWRGYIKRANTVVDEDNGKIISFNCEGREAELRWANTYRGILINNQTASNALSALLTGTLWTGAIEGTFENVTRRYDDKNIFEAIADLAKILQGFVRYDNVNRVVTISNTPPASGITLRQSFDPADGILNKLTEVSNDRSELWNRIVPRGLLAGNIEFDLTEANPPTVPYTINDFIKIMPSITSIVDDDIGWTPVAHIPTDFSIEVECTGRNCAVVMVLHADSVLQYGDPFTARINGVTMTRERSTTGAGGDIANLWVFAGAAKPGTNTITFQITIPNSNPIEAHIHCIALQDAAQRQQSLVIGGEAETGGSSTSPSASVATDIGYLVIGVLSHSSGTATPAAGLTELLDHDVGWLSVVIGYRYATADPQTIAWTKGSSNAWTLCAFEINPVDIFYIEDAASQAEYGLRVRELSLSDIAIFEKDGGGLEAAANALYYYAVNFLDEHKSPKKRWNSDVLWLPKGPLDWDVGSEIDLEFEDINETLVVPRRTQVFTPDGVRTWELELSTRNEFRGTFIDLVAQMQSRLNATQFNQV